MRLAALLPVLTVLAGIPKPALAVCQRAEVRGKFMDFGLVGGMGLKQLQLFAHLRPVARVDRIIGQVRRLEGRQHIP